MIEVFFIEKTSRKENHLKRSSKQNAWKTQTRLEQGPRDGINSAKWLNLICGKKGFVCMNGELFVKEASITQRQVKHESHVIMKRKRLIVGIVDILH